MTNRLFVAVNVPEEIKEQIISIRKELYQSSQRAKWERKEKLHFTIKFLGDVPEESTDDVVDTLSNAVRKQKKFKCDFNKFDFFYRKRNPSILFLDLKFNNEMKAMAERIDTSLHKLGFEKEKRKFKPHITLLRLRGYEDVEELNKFKNYNIPELSFTCNEIILIKSILKPETSVYYNIEKFKFI